MWLTATDLGLLELIVYQTVFFQAVFNLLLGELEEKFGQI